MSALKIITVASPQGGAGKSMLALNLAIQFAKQDLRVLLMDMACFGGLPAMLKLPVRGKGLSSLITALEQSEGLYQTDHFSSLFFDAIHQDTELSQLHIMLSASPLDMEKLSEHHCRRLIQLARRENYDVVLLDTSSELCERNIACLEEADYILIPALQDVASGWKIMQFKSILDNLNVPKEKISLVINRCSKYSVFNNQEYQAEIGYSIIAELNDFSKAVHRSANKGVPLIRYGKRETMLPFQKLAAQVLKRVGS